MSEADADHHRYRALLRDADDEPKRLALIQLLIDERARDRLAVRLKPSRPEPSPEYEPFAPLAAPMPTQRLAPSHEVAVPAARLWPDQPDRSAAADDAPIDRVDLAAPPSVSDSEPPTPPFPPPARGPEPTEPAPEEMTAAAEKVAVVSAASIPSEPASSPGPSPAASDVDIATRIEAALTELTRVHGPQEQLHGGEARLSPPARAPSEIATPDAMQSVPAVRTATHGLVERLARLLGKRLAAGIAEPAAPPFDDEEENSIVRQIQAALAKQKGDS